AVGIEIFVLTPPKRFTQGAKRARKTYGVFFAFFAPLRETGVVFVCWDKMKIVLPILVAVSASAMFAQAGAADWPMYNRDSASTRYSPLTQINTKNAGKLTKAWSYELKSLATGRGAPRSSGSEVTPIVVDGVMYMPAAGRVAEQSRRHLLAGRQGQSSADHFYNGPLHGRPQREDGQDGSRLRKRGPGRSDRPV